MVRPPHALGSISLNGQGPCVPWWKNLAALSNKCASWRLAFRQVCKPAGFLALMAALLSVPLLLLARRAVAVAPSWAVAATAAAVSSHVDCVHTPARLHLRREHTRLTDWAPERIFPRLHGHAREFHSLLQQTDKDTTCMLQEDGNAFMPQRPAPQGAAPSTDARPRQTIVDGSRRLSRNKANPKHNTAASQHRCTQRLLI